MSYFLLGMFVQLTLIVLFNHSIDAFMFGSLLTVGLGVHTFVAHLKAKQKAKMPMAVKKPEPKIIVPFSVAKKPSVKRKTGPVNASASSPILAFQFRNASYALNRCA